MSPFRKSLSSFRSREDDSVEILNERNLRISENKNPEEEDWKKFENKFWIEIEKFGPSVISHINCSSGGSGDTIYKWGPSIQQSQQIDCLFIHRDIAFYCEITDQSTPSLTRKITNFKNQRQKVTEGGIVNFLKTKYNVEKIVWLFVASQPLEQSHIDLLKRNDIPYVDSKYLKYLESIHSSYGSDYKRLAFNNFIQDIIDSNSELRISSGEQIFIPAIQYMYKKISPTKKGYCYSLSIHPKHLIDISSVIHRKNDYNMDKSYQRFVKRSRLNSIKEFTENESQFSNNIILCSEDINDSSFLPVKVNTEVQGGKLIRNVGFNGKIGLLKLPNIIGSLNIIDGQHRLIGYENSSKNMTHYVNAVIYDKSLKDNGPMKIFMDINDNQKPLNKSLKWELFEHTLTDDRIEQQISKFGVEATRDEDFILYRKIKLAVDLDGVSNEKNVRLPFSTVCDILLEKKSYNNNESIFERMKLILNDDHGKIKKFLNGYFKAFKNKSNDDWISNSSGLIFNGNFFKALIIILKECIIYWESKGVLSQKIRNLDNISDDFEEILKPVFDIINNKTSTEKSAFKDKHKGMNGPINIAVILADGIKNSDGFIDFGQNILRFQTNSDIIDGYILKILNSNLRETDYLEAKEVIFGTQIGTPGSSERKAIAEHNLRTANAMHNHIGGRIVIGIKEDRNAPPGQPVYSIVGIEDEINENANGDLEDYKQKLKNIIRNRSGGKINPKIDALDFLEKKIIIISIKKKQNIIEISDFDTWKYKHKHPEKERSDEDLLKFFRDSDETMEIKANNIASYLQETLTQREDNKELSKSQYFNVIDDTTNDIDNSVDMHYDDFRLKY